MGNIFRSWNAALFAAGGLVGVLFLSGAAQAVTDKVFQYTTPKTGYYGLSPMAFTVSEAIDPNIASFDIQAGFLKSSSYNGCFQTGVNLPEGAKMTALTAWYQTDTVGNMVMHLYRSRSANGTLDTVTTLTSTDASSTRKSMSINIPDSAQAIVDNKSYTYSVDVCLGEVAGDAPDRYYAGRITYTYTNAGD